MTFIGFPDITVSSPAGTFRVEIRGNGQEEPFRNQSGFVYRLIETKSDCEVWQWSPGSENRAADYPHEAWVNDEGWVVVRLHEWWLAAILVLSPDGECRMLRYMQSIDDDDPGLFQDETDSHMGSTSAGPNWEETSIAQFSIANRRHYWSILTWWGRRLVIELEAGAAVEAITDQHREVIEKLEHDWIMSRLATTATELQTTNDEDWKWWSRIGRPAYTAAFHAGALNIKAGIPHLQAMASSPVTGSYTVGHRIKVIGLPFRFIAKISLLRLGIEPQWFANHELKNKHTGERCDYPECVELRKPELIEEGMSKAEMLHLIGVPEFLNEFRWEYVFVEGGQPFALAVHWLNKHKMEFFRDEQEQEIERKRYYEAMDREPPVAERVERIEALPWVTHDYKIAHQCLG